MRAAASTTSGRALLVSRLGQLQAIDAMVPRDPDRSRELAEQLARRVAAAVDGLLPASWAPPHRVEVVKDQVHLWSGTRTVEWMLQRRQPDQTLTGDALAVAQIVGEVVSSPGLSALAADYLTARAAARWDDTCRARTGTVASSLADLLAWEVRTLAVRDDAELLGLLDRFVVRDFDGTPADALRTVARLLDASAA